MDSFFDSMKEKVEAKDYAKLGKEYDKAYRSGRPFRNPNFFMEKLKSLIDKKAGKSRKILDIACGDGHFLSNFKDYDVYGVDISKDAIKKAKKLEGTWKVSKAEKLPFGSSQFDFVTCLGSLEHFIDMHAALKEMKRVAKKNATIIIHVPNSNYLVHKILRVDTHHQINERFASEKEWKQVLEKHFTVEKTIKYNTRWFLKALPKRWSCHFTFVCRN